MPSRPAGSDSGSVAASNVAKMSACARDEVGGTSITTPCGLTNTTRGAEFVANFRAYRYADVGNASAAASVLQHLKPQNW